MDIVNYGKELIEMINRVGSDSKVVGYI